MPIKVGVVGVIRLCLSVASAVRAKQIMVSRKMKLSRGCNETIYGRFFSRVASTIAAINTPGMGCRPDAYVVMA